MSSFSVPGNSISQEAYNEMIQENITDFDMTLEESIKETLKQCQSMGINLDAIDLTGGQERAELDLALEALASGTISIDQVKVIQAKCNKENQHFLRNQNIVYNKGSVKALSLLLDAAVPDLSIAVANTCVTASVDHPRNRYASFPYILLPSLTCSLSQRFFRCRVVCPSVCAAAITGGSSG